MDTTLKNPPPSRWAFIPSATKTQLGLLFTSIFEHAGYFTTPGQGLSIHGIDHILYKPDLSEPEIALRCRPDTAIVDLREVTRFWKTITSRGYTRGIFVTNHSFTPSAVEYSARRNLIVIDGENLEKGLEELSDAEQERILECFGNSRRPLAPAISSSRPPVVEPRPKRRSRADTRHHEEPDWRDDPRRRAVTKHAPKPEYQSAEPSGPTRERTRPRERKKAAATVLATVCPITVIAAAVLFWDTFQKSRGYDREPIAGPSSSSNYLLESEYDSLEP